MNNESLNKARLQVIEACAFLQKLDNNGSFLDDLDLKLSTIENIADEIKILGEIVDSYWEENCLTIGEESYLTNLLSSAKSSLGGSI
jgi:hypothetical protein